MRTARLTSYLESIKSVRLWSLCLPIIVLLPIGCGANMNRSTTQFAAAGPTGHVAAGQIVEQIRALQDPANKVMYEKVRAMTLTDLFTNAANVAPTGPIVLGGHTFDNLHDFLARHNDMLLELSANYGTVGGYADAMGLAKVKDVSADKMQKAFDMMDMLINKKASLATTNSKFKLAENSAIDDIENQWNTPQMKGLALGTKIGCAGAIIGTAAASVGAGVACAATIGVACGGAVLGVAGAGTGAVNACDGVIGGSSQQPQQPQDGAGTTITTTYGGDGASYGGDTQSPSCSGNANMTVHQADGSTQNIPCG